MSVRTANHRDRWDNPAYRRIERARFDENAGMLNVTFQDRTEVAVSLESILPAHISDVDYWRIGSNQIELIVPHEAGWLEVPWDVIRRATDPDYAAHWAGHS